MLAEDTKEQPKKKLLNTTNLQTPGKIEPLEKVAGSDFDPKEMVAGAEFDPQKATVQGQLGGILKKDSPLMDRARTSAQQWANQRGLLNSSMAAQAGEAAQIDAATPIAQQDAQTYSKMFLNKQGFEQQQELNQNQYAQERAVEQYKQQNLAWTQVLKGISDIQMQDINPSDKDQAVQNLWDMYTRGRPFSSSLTNMEIKDGQVMYSGGGEMPAMPGGTVDKTVTFPTGGTDGTSGVPRQDSTGGVPRQQENLIDYKSVDQMNDVEKYVWKQQYGTLQPPQVKDAMAVKNRLDRAYSKYLVDEQEGDKWDWYWGSHGSSYTGTRFNKSAARRGYDEQIKKEFEKLGIKGKNLKLLKSVFGADTRNPLEEWKKRSVYD